MRGVKPAEYAKHLSSERGRTEFYLNETTVLKTLSGIGAFSLLLSVLWIFPGAFFWGDLYCAGGSGNYWDMCDGGTVGIWVDGIFTALIIFIGGVSVYYSAMLLENLIGIRRNTEKKETE
jgi:hypothetical protein